MLGLCVYIFSVNRSIDHLLRKWNLQCENVPLSTFSSVQVFNSSTQEEIQHDEQSFQMLVISRRSTWRICTVPDVRSMFMEKEEWTQIIITAWATLAQSTRADYDPTVLTYRCLRNTAPCYLTETVIQPFSICTLRHHLQSASMSALLPYTPLVTCNL